MKPTPEALGRLAAVIRSEHTDRGVLARVRRQSPHTPTGAALFDLQSLLWQAGLDPADDRDFADWALVAHCLALCQGRNDPQAPAGEQLALIGLTEARMRVLCEAGCQALRELLPRVARRVAASGVALNWWPLAVLVFFERSDPALTESTRRHLIAGYLRAASPAKST